MIRYLHKAWSQIGISTFSTRALLLVHHKMGVQLSQLFLMIFLNSLIHYLMFKFCSGLFFWGDYFIVVVKMCARFLYLIFECFLKNLFSIFTYRKNLRFFRGYFCRPQVKWVKSIFFSSIH